MNKSTRRRAWAFAAASLPLGLGALAVACGSRTGLLGDGAPGAGAPGTFGGPVGEDAGGAADATVAPAADALPPLDARKPKPDAVNREGCPAGETLVYVMTEQNALYAFDPRDVSFRAIGTIRCPGTRGATPFSMAVDRTGVAHVVFNDGQLYRVSTKNAGCTSTPFEVGQHSFVTFGMGYAWNDEGRAETLYVVENPADNTALSQGLAWIDTVDYRLHYIGPFDRDIPRAELTGTGDGRLFAFHSDPSGDASLVAEIDKTNARVVGASDVAVPARPSAFAFAFWGGDFWIFTATQTQGPSTVSRFRPSDGTTRTVGTMKETIVGAGVSTCAPQ